MKMTIDVSVQDPETLKKLLDALEAWKGTYSLYELSVKLDGTFVLYKGTIT